MKAKLFVPSPYVPRPKKTRLTRVILLILLLTIALILASSTSQAHGGGGFYLLRGISIAPYSVHVWTSPGILRTGDVHIDTSVFDSNGAPVPGVLVRVRFIPLDSETLPQVALAGAPDRDYPFSRGAAFRLDTPGQYRLEVSISDSNGVAGATHTDVEVTKVGWPFKAALILLFIGTMMAGAWLVYQTRVFWVGSELARHKTLRHLQVHSAARTSFIRGGIAFMREQDIYALQPAVWIFMLIIVGHWTEHVLQIYQIYALGWSPDKAGGLIGLVYPGLVESETLHFVYDLIQWAGILILLPGFKGRARQYWVVSMVIQSWHYIEHVLLMGQYLTGYYLFGAAHQISILELWFPRAELHFSYNLLVYIPMVIAIHYYLQPKLEALAAVKARQANEK